MKISKLDILKYSIDLVIVISGVFLGIYISGLKENRSINLEKEKSIKYIISELENNLKLINGHITYHELIKQQIDSIIPTLSEEVKFSSFIKYRDNEIKGWEGFLYARIQYTAFEGAKLSGIMQEMDLELIQEISYIYTFQKAYSDFGTSILNKAFETNSSTKVIDFLDIIQIMTSDLLNLEKGLSDEIEKTITDLKRYSQ